MQNHIVYHSVNLILVFPLLLSLFHLSSLEEAGPCATQGSLRPVRGDVRPVHRSAVPGQPVPHSPKHPVPVWPGLCPRACAPHLSWAGPTRHVPLSPFLSPISDWHAQQVAACPQTATETKSAPSTATHYPPQCPPANGTGPDGRIVPRGEHVHR